MRCSSLVPANRKYTILGEEGSPDVDEGVGEADVAVVVFHWGPEEGIKGHKVPEDGGDEGDDDAEDEVPEVPGTAVGPLEAWALWELAAVTEDDLARIQTAHIEGQETGFLGWSCFGENI